MKVKANSLYYFNPCGWELISPCVGAEKFKKGDRVRVVNLHGCPKANTMGQCYIVPADAKQDKRGRWDKDFAMVSTNSLQREPVNMFPLAMKDVGAGFYLVQNGTGGEGVPVMKDGEGRVTRLFDGVFIDGLVEHSTCRVITKNEATQAVEQYRAVVSPRKDEYLETMMDRAEGK